MNHQDVEMFAEAHRESPRRVTLFSVALAMEKRARQGFGVASPAELKKLTGVLYDNAKKALRDAREHLDHREKGITQESPGGDHPVIPGGSPSDPGGDHPVIPGGSPSDPGGDHPVIPFRSIQEKRQEELNTTTRTYAREGADSIEPFADPDPPPMGGMPNPSGEDSPEADRLAAMFAGTETPNHPRMDYGEAARLLCRDYAAEWVEVLLTCHRKLWLKTPGYSRLVQTLHQWQADGQIDPRFIEAFRPKPREFAPARASPSGTAADPSFDPLDAVFESFRKPKP